MREGTCAACEQRFDGPKRGPIPALCPQCRLTLPGSEQQAIAQAFNARRWPGGTDARMASAQTAAAMHWTGHQRKIRPEPQPLPQITCPYCGDLMPATGGRNGGGSPRKQCGKQECHKQFQRDRCREWQREYSAEHGVGYALARDPDKRRAGRRQRRAREYDAPGAYTAADVRAQYARQRGKCYWQTSELCKTRGGKLGDDYQPDHVVPLILGGSNWPSNLVVSCSTCNYSKAGQHPMDWAGVMF